VVAERVLARQSEIIRNIRLGVLHPKPLLCIALHPRFMPMVRITGRRILRLAQLVIARRVREGAEVVVVGVVFSLMMMTT
jgi:hypothetical protein